MYHDRKPSRQETRSRPTPSSAVYHSTINAATSDASRVIDDYDRAASLGLGININSVDSILNHHPSELLANMTNTPWVPNRALPPASFPKVGWRKGKWLDEEEAYTRKLIEAFNAGFLNLPSGTTLRSFLSERLCCDPMRITKKFSGSSCIGKQIYSPCDSKTDPELIMGIQTELKDLEEKFRAKIDFQRMNELYALAPLANLPTHPSLAHTSAQGGSGVRPMFLEGLPPEYLQAALAALPLSKSNGSNVPQYLPAAAAAMVAASCSMQQQQDLLQQHPSLQSYYLAASKAASSADLTQAQADVAMFSGPANHNRHRNSSSSSSSTASNDRAAMTSASVLLAGVRHHAQPNEDEVLPVGALPSSQSPAASLAAAVMAIYEPQRVSSTGSKSHKPSSGHSRLYEQHQQQQSSRLPVHPPLHQQSHHLPPSPTNKPRTVSMGSIQSPSVSSQNSPNLSGLATEELPAQLPRTMLPAPQQASRQSTGEANKDLYASHLLMNFFIAAGQFHSANSGTESTDGTSASAAATEIKGGSINSTDISSNNNNNRNNISNKISPSTTGSDNSSDAGSDHQDNMPETLHSGSSALMSLLHKGYKNGQLNQSSDSLAIVTPASHHDANHHKDHNTNRSNSFHNDHSSSDNSSGHTSDHHDTPFRASGSPPEQDYHPSHPQENPDPNQEPSSKRRRLLDGTSASTPNETVNMII